MAVQKAKRVLTSVCATCEAKIVLRKRVGDTERNPFDSLTWYNQESPQIEILTDEDKWKRMYERNMPFCNPKAMRGGYHRPLTVCWHHMDSGGHCEAPVSAENQAEGNLACGKHMKQYMKSKAIALSRNNETGANDMRRFGMEINIEWLKQRGIQARPDASQRWDTQWIHVDAESLVKYVDLLEHTVDSLQGTTGADIDFKQKEEA